MMRKPPEGVPPGLEPKPDQEKIIQTRHYRVITPLFGGGVKAGEVDLETPVRGSTIRGQLRFWWRATRGGRFEGDLAQMKAAEDDIWGSTEGVSKVSIAVKTVNIGQPFVVPSTDPQGRRRTIGDPGSIYGYVGFPLRPTEGTVREGVAFELTLSFPAGLCEELRAALWAWDTFGGVGARTRRGFGALACETVQMAGASCEQENEDWLWQYDSRTLPRELLRDVNKFVEAGAPPPGVSQLSRKRMRYRVVAGPNATELAAWENLIAALKAFRQNRSGDQGHGRSNWPEPDAIRDITGQHGNSFKHDVPVHGRLIRKFPRAMFGLPIVFEFKPGQTHPSNTNNDPRKTTLDGVEFKRLASPLIIRPLLCRDRSVGLAAVLEGPRPWNMGGLALREADQTIIESALEARLSESERDLVDRENDLYDGTPDILQSFLNIL
jgi:CRISPR-associated protein Cmr1